MGLTIGLSEVNTKTITQKDVDGFAAITGDNNPIHVDKVKAEQSVFGGRIVHGLLLGGYISKIIGTTLPGEGTIYMEQDMKFLTPVYVGDTVRVTVTVAEAINETKGIYRLETIVWDETTGKQAVDGYAVVKVV